MPGEVPDDALDGSGRTVNTVLGPVDPDSLGVVLPHEHVLVDLRKRFVPPTESAEQTLSSSPVDLTTLSWVRFNQERSLDNLHLSDVDTATTELLAFQLRGGGAVVDLTPGHAGRDVGGLIRVSRATGLHIVMGTGLYLAPFHEPEVRASSPERLAQRMVEEIRNGVGSGGVRAGIIGEMGCSWPLEDTERNALVAAAIAQQETGAAISVHPGRDPAAPPEILDVLFSAGAVADRIVICHVDRTLHSAQDVVDLARRGIFVEVDLFGQESWHTRYGPVPLPSDLERLRTIAALFDHGFGEQVLVSQDIALKHHLQRYGGHGYGHLVQRVAPRLAEAGVTGQMMEQVMQRNPRRLLAIPAKQLG
jgi:phosphotriesterase-related protein